VVADGTRLFDWPNDAEPGARSAAIGPKWLPKILHIDKSRMNFSLSVGSGGVDMFVAS
jgi:hypothetical protein